MLKYVSSITIKTVVSKITVFDLFVDKSWIQSDCYLR